MINKYKNGREARHGDPVVGIIGKGTTAPRVAGGRLLLHADGNHTIGVPVEGGEQRHAIAVVDLVHAEDAFAAATAASEAPAAPAKKA